MEEGRIQARRRSSTKGGEEMIEGPRLLNKDIDQVTATLSTTGTSFTIVANGDGWVADYHAIGGAHMGVLRWQGYIDLSGYTREDRTFFPGVPIAQDGGYYGMSAGTYLAMYTMITQSPIDETSMLSNTLDFTVPGFLGSTTNPDQVTWGIGSTMAPGSTHNNLLSVQDAWSWGTGNPTATDRLYIYKFAHVITETEDVSVQLPPTHILVPGMVEGEADLVYMQRLRRSFELQQTPDID